MIIALVPAVLAGLLLDLLAMSRSYLLIFSLLVVLYAWFIGSRIIPWAMARKFHAR